MYVLFDPSFIFYNHFSSLDIGILSYRIPVWTIILHYI